MQKVIIDKILFLSWTFNRMNNKLIPNLTLFARLHLHCNFHSFFLASSPLLLLNIDRTCLLSSLSLLWSICHSFKLKFATAYAWHRQRHCHCFAYRIPNTYGVATASSHNPSASRLQRNFASCRQLHDAVLWPLLFTHSIRLYIVCTCRSPDLNRYRESSSLLMFPVWLDHVCSQCNCLTVVLLAYLFV